MDPVSSAVSASKTIAEGGFTTFLVFLVVVLIIPLRGVFLKYNQARQGQIDDDKLYAVALKDAAEAIEESKKLLLSQAVDIGKLKLMLEHSRGAV